MTDSPDPSQLPGIVLAGGSGRRLGGADKAALRIGGETLVARALSALRDCGAVVVVGATQAAPTGVPHTSEQPPGGGPAAGLLAGLNLVSDGEEWVAVLAVDMPHVTDATIGRLLAAAENDGALLVDGDGRRQYLCAVYRQASLVAAAERAGDLHGLSMRRLVEDLQLVGVAAVGQEPLDIDDPADMALIDEDTRPIALDDR